MKLFISIHDEIISIRARAEGPDGLLGDLFCQIRKGESFSLGRETSISYDTFIAHGDGLFDS